MQHIGLRVVKDWASGERWGVSWSIDSDRPALIGLCCCAAVKNKNKLIISLFDFHLNTDATWQFAFLIIVPMICVKVLPARWA